TLPLDEPEERARVPLHHGEGLAVPGAERDARGGVVASLPDVSSGGVLELRQLRRAPERPRAQLRGPGHPAGRLPSGRADARVEDPRVGVVEDRRLDAAREEGIRLLREELVERVLARDEDRQAAIASPGPSPLLAQRRDRPGESDRDRAVEKTDVDAELERVR